MIWAILMETKIDNDVLNNLLITIEQSKNNNDNQSLVSSYLSLAKLYKRYKNHNEAKIFLNQAIDKLESNPDIDPQIGFDIYNLTADLFLKRHALIRAEIFYKKALALAKEGVKGPILSKLAHVNIRQGDYDDAISFADLAKQEFEKTKDVRALSVVLKFKITIYARTKKNDLALSTFEELNKDYENALTYYERAWKADSHEEKNLEIIIYMARIFLKLGQSKKALPYLEKAFEDKNRMPAACDHPQRSPTP